MKVHSVEIANLRRRTTSSAWINTGNGKGSHRGFGDSTHRHASTHAHTHTHTHTHTHYENLITISPCRKYVAAPIKKKKKNALWTVSSGTICHVPCGGAARVSTDNRVHSRVRIDLHGLLAGVSEVRLSRNRMSRLETSGGESIPS